MMMYQSQFIEMVGNPRTNPKGWPMKRLPDAASYSIGLTYKPENVCEDGTIVLRSGNIQEGEIDLYDLVRVNTPIRDNLWVKEGDILMCSRNGSASLVGKVAQIKSIKEPMTYGAFMTIIRSDYSDYLYLYFQSGDFRDQISGGKSSTMNQITQKMLDKIEIPLPNQQIINSLSAILKQADKSKFGNGFKSQFIEMFGDPMTNDMGWEEYGEISRFARIVLGSTPKSTEPAYWDGDIKWITPAEMTEESYYINDTERHLTETGLKSANLTLLPYRAVLFSTRAPIGKVGIVGSPMYCNQGFKNFICGDMLNPVFLFYTLKFKKDYLVSLGTGTTFKELSKKTVESLKIIVPNIELQNRFEEIYNQADKSKSVCRQAIKRLVS
jgi:restriction endonuclease S subunit